MNAQSDSIAPGTVIDRRFQIVRIVGEGEMGSVYEARTQDGQRVGLKVMREGLESNEDLRTRFQREAQALFSLQHPNLLRVFDLGLYGDRPFLVMEYLDGSSLDELVEEGIFSPEQCFDLARQISAGLAYAHRAGVLHRDIKTENVFVTRDQSGQPIAKLVDFGLVKFVDDDKWGSGGQKLTVQGAVFGTPAYMPPEQCAGAPADARCDVYSTGVVFFEMFTGLWPFMEETRMAMFQAHMAKKPPSLSESSDVWNYRQELEAVIATCLAKRPDQRYADGAALEAAMAAIPRPIAQRAIPEAHGIGEGVALPNAQNVNAPNPNARLLGVAALIAGVLILILAAVFLMRTH